MQRNLSLNFLFCVPMLMLYILRVIKEVETYSYLVLKKSSAVNVSFVQDAWRWEISCLIKELDTLHINH